MTKLTNGVIPYGSLFREKKDPKPTWCKICGRKHPRRKECELELVKSHMNNKNRKIEYKGFVGHYKVKLGEKNG